MSKKKFNPKDWVTPNGEGVLHTPTVEATLAVAQNNNPSTDIETITQRIETAASR